MAVPVVVGGNGANGAGNGNAGNNAGAGGNNAAGNAGGNANAGAGAGANNAQAGGNNANPANPQVTSSGAAGASSVSGGTAVGTGTATGTTISIPQTAAAGGILMTMPPQTASISFYKIAPSNPITFAWNFTSLYVQPATLTVSAVDTQQGFTYTIGGPSSNGILPGTATSVVWDPYAYEQQPGALQLAQATYVLHINDENGDQARGTPGRFQAYSGLKFALYKPGQATPLANWNCPGCSSSEKLVMNSNFIAVMFTALVMLFSGYGIIRRGLMR